MGRTVGNPYLIWLGESCPSYGARAREIVKVTDPTQWFRRARLPAAHRSATANAGSVRPWNLTRVMTAIDGSSAGPLFSAATRAEFTANAAIPRWSTDPNYWYGLGIFVGAESGLAGSEKDTCPRRPARVVPRLEAS